MKLHVANKITIILVIENCTVSQWFPAGHSLTVVSCWAQSHSVFLLGTVSQCFPAGHSLTVFSCWAQSHSVFLLGLVTYIDNNVVLVVFFNLSEIEEDRICLYSNG